MDTPEDRRLHVLRGTQLLDSPPARAFDRLTRMAARMMDAPAALVSLVDEHRQFFKSAYGLGEPWASKRETPLSHSFCQYAVRDRTPLVVRDAREHPLLRRNLAIEALHVIAYAGIPLFIQDEAIGVFCVVDDKPRSWSAEQLEQLTDLAESVVSEIELHLALRAAGEQRALTETLLDSLGDGVLAIDTHRKFLIANTAARRVLGLRGMFAQGAAAEKPLPSDWAAIHRSTLPDGSRLAEEDGALPRALRGLETDGLELTLQRPGARAAVWMEVSGRPVRGPDGKIIAGVAVYRDITERKQRIDLFTALARNIPGGAVVLFDEELRCVAIDGGLLRAEGLDPKNAVGRTMRELASVAGTAPPDPSFDAVELAYRRTLAGESLVLDYVRREQTLALHTAPVRDGLDKVVAGIVLAMDVTAQRADQAAVVRSEQLYRAIVQNLPRGAVFMVSQDLRYLSADGPALSEILEAAGTPVVDIVGRSVDEVVSPANREATIDLLRAALAGASQRIEIRSRDRFFELAAEPIRDPGTREIAAALLCCFEITERKRADELRARERQLLEQFHAFVEHISTGITVVQNGRIVYVNPELCRILGYDSAVGVVGQRALEFLIHPDDRGAVAVRMDTAVTDAILPRRSKLLRSDGSTVIVETSARPFLFDGEPSVIAASRDLTTEITAEAARREHVAGLETFRLMVDVIRDYAIFQLDREGRVKTWNSGARAIKGYEASEVLGKHIRIFYAPDDAGTSELALVTAATTERYRDEGWRVRKDGSRFWASVTITALRDPGTSGEIMGFVKVTRDLTEAKQVEDAKARSLAEKTAMLQEIHHRVKNNLQMISSLLNLQARQLQDKQAKALFLDTQSRVRSIALLHESLYQSDDLGRVDMREYIERLLATLRRAYGDSSHCTRFAISVARVFLPLDAAVPCGLIINELVTNALKHAFVDSREVARNEIRIALGRDQGLLTMSVADNGVGFADAANPAGEETMGVMLIRDLSLQLRGQVEFTNASGALCTIRFPAPDPARELS